MSDVIDVIIEAMKGTLLDETARKSFFIDFCKRHNLDPRTKLNPEIRRLLAEELTDRIMSDARRMRGGDNA